MSTSITPNDFIRMSVGPGRPISVAGFRGEASVEPRDACSKNSPIWLAEYFTVSSSGQMYVWQNQSPNYHF
jgi:hypothetical protein